MRKHWYLVDFVGRSSGGSERSSMCFGFFIKSINSSNIKWMESQSGIAGSTIANVEYVGYMTKEELES